MCMEDVRIGRKTSASQVDLTVGLTSIQAIGGSPNRYCLVFSAPIAGHVTYSLDNPAVLGNGINLGVGDGMYSLNIQHHGDIVRRPWFAISDAASSPVGIMFTELGDQ